MVAPGGCPPAATRQQHQAAGASTSSSEAPAPAAVNGHANGHAFNGHAANGHAANGHAANGHAANGVAAANGAAKAAANGATIAITAACGSSADHPVALDPRKKVAFALMEKAELSPNVRRFRFALPSPQHKFGLPVGKHVFMYATIGGETVMRAYTPTTGDEHLGYFDLVVKVYRAGQHPAFPEGGKMSQHLDALIIGDALEFKGPVGHVVYEGRGRYTLNRKPGHATAINLVAGGTGITPCWQVLRTVLNDAQDATQVRLVYANRHEEDILLREELDAYARAHPDRFKVWYTLDQPPAGWGFSVGHINEQMLREQLQPAGPGVITGLCGPPGLIKHACLPALTAMGFSEEQLIQF